jgi:uncharacterized protein with GYD domain
MYYVILAEHVAHECPTSSARTKALMEEIAPQIPKIAEQHGITIASGPFVNREHLTVVVVQADRAENIDRFIVESRLHQWNRVRVIPSLPMEEAMKDMEEVPSLF